MPLTHVEQIDTTQNLLGDVLLIRKPPGRKRICLGFFGWEGFGILIVLILF